MTAIPGSSVASLISGIPDAFIYENFNEFAKDYTSILQQGTSKAKLESFFAQEIETIKDAYAQYLDNEQGYSLLIASRDAALGGDLQRLENEAVFSEVLALASQGDQRAITALAGFGVKSQIYQTRLLQQQRAALEEVTDSLLHTRGVSLDLLNATKVREALLDADYIIELEAKRLRGRDVLKNLGKFRSIAQARAKHMLVDLLYEEVDFEKYRSDLDAMNSNKLNSHALAILRRKYPSVEQFTEVQISSAKASLRVSYDLLGYVII